MLSSLRINICGYLLQFSSLLRPTLMLLCPSWGYCVIPLGSASGGIWLGDMHRNLPLNDKILHFICLGIATGLFYWCFEPEEYVVLANVHHSLAAHRFEPSGLSRSTGRREEYGFGAMWDLSVHLHCAFSLVLSCRNMFSLYYQSVHSLPLILHRAS